MVPRAFSGAWRIVVNRPQSMSISPAFGGGADVGLAALLLLFEARAAAQESGCLTLMSEPIGYTARRRRFRRGRPARRRRPPRLPQLGRSRDRPARGDRRRLGRTGVAASTSSTSPTTTQSRNELLLQLDVGIYRDLMVFVAPADRARRRPRAAAADGRAAARTRPRPRPLELRRAARADRRRRRRAAVRPLAARGRAPLGLPSIDFGVACGVTNQYRDATLADLGPARRGLDRHGPGDERLRRQGCDPGHQRRHRPKLRLESRWSYRYQLLRAVPRRRARLCVHQRREAAVRADRTTCRARSTTSRRARPTRDRPGVHPVGGPRPLPALRARPAREGRRWSLRAAP